MESSMSIPILISDQAEVWYLSICDLEELVRLLGYAALALGE